MFLDRISRVEAYALKKNKRSITLMRDMGFSEIHDTMGTKFLHFEIETNKIMAIIKR
jgi:RimJ/RimL family protein N-acetyltransferase